MVCTLHVLRRLVSPRQKISRSCFFFTIFCSTSWDLSIWSKKIKILSKKIFTEYKDDYVTFWEICETKILLPSIFFNFFPLKYHWNKKMLLASICKRYIFFHIRASTNLFLVDCERVRFIQEPKFSFSFCIFLTCNNILTHYKRC